MVITSLIGTAHADGDSLVDTLGPREVAVGEALRAGATGATAIGMNPAGLPLNRELVFEGGYGYRLSDNASLVGVSACDSTNAMPGCFYYSYSTTDMYRTHVAGSSIAYPISPRVSLGTSLKYFNFSSESMSEPKTSGFTFDAGTTLRITELVNLGVAGYNLFGKDSTEFNRAVGGGLMAKPIPALAISFDARWKLESDDHTARYGGGAELFLRSGNGQTGFPIRAGVLHDNFGMGTTFVSGGVGMASMKFAIDVAGRVAVSGNDETTIIASMRFFGPRLAAPNVGGAE